MKIKLKNGEKKELNEIDDIDFLKHYIREKFSEKINTLDANVKCKNNMDRLKMLISVIYDIKSFYNRGSFKKDVSDKYKTALCVYVMYGYNKESKNKIKKMLGYKKQTQVNLLNNKLRQLDLLHKDEINNRVSHLCDELKVLSK